METSVQYSVPQEAKKLFVEGILQNPLIAKDLPPEALEFADRITFDGSPDPSLPINWRFAESITSLKAYEGTLLNVLLKRKYGFEPVKININTDHAQLFIMSSLLWTLDPEGAKINAGSVLTPEGREKVGAYFPDWDKHKSSSSFHRLAATNIYKTKDDRYFHLHGSMNPDPTLESVGLPHDNAEATSLDEAMKPFIKAVGEITSDDLQHRAADIYRQAGTIAYTIDEYKNSEHGKANANTGLFEIHNHPNPAQKPGWWPDAPHTSAARPLAGLKVVDLTRVIAAPAISRGLAELGASVMRIVAPHITDLSPLHCDLNHGKWNACLDLRQEGDRQKLRELIVEADVFLQGYRPGVFDKYGFSEQDVLDLCKSRGRGIIYARENCYGWNGPWSGRSGWQQISDANCGVSYEFGRAMGNDEPVTPVFPNSDYCTGVAGIAGILTALLHRAEIGGSFTVDIALNYYSQWLVNSCGVYPAPVWKQLWAASGSPVLRHTDPMQVLIPRVMNILHQTSAQKLFRPDFFTKYHCRSLGLDVKIVGPVLRFPGGEVEPGYTVGTRTNGVDQPRWPEDLTVEVVT